MVKISHALKFEIIGQIISHALKFELSVKIISKVLKFEILGDNVTCFRVEVIG